MMRNDKPAIHAISELLRRGDFKSHIEEKAIPRTFYYDLTYKLSIISIAIKMGSKEVKGKEGMFCFYRDLISLYQFIAIRPRLLSDFEGWRKNERTAQFAFGNFPVIPRGFLSDVDFFKLIEFMIAIGELTSDGTKKLYFNYNKQSKIIMPLYSFIVEEGLFEKEQVIIRKLISMKIKLNELG